MNTVNKPKGKKLKESFGELPWQLRPYKGGNLLDNLDGSRC